MNRNRKQVKGQQCKAALERAQAIAEGPQKPMYDHTTRTATWKTTEEAFKDCKRFLKLRTTDWPTYLNQLARKNYCQPESSTSSMNQESA
ncbi:hypothetical protein Dimus_004179, partial [Dionaea muscipula]